MLKEFYDKIYADWKRKIIENAKRKETFRVIKEVPLILAHSFI